MKEYDWTRSTGKKKGWGIELTELSPPSYCRIVCFLTLLLAATIGMGCSTVSSRIREHMSEFNSYPSSIQDEIEKGEIDREFTEEMVYMAKGEPSEKVTVREGTHQLVLWNYNRPSFVAMPGNSEDTSTSPYGYPVVGPGPVRPSGVIASRPYFTIRFEDGKVVDWSEAKENERRSEK